MIAAERTLFIRTGRTTVKVPVIIEVPFFDRNAWICKFSIGWPEGTAYHHGMGFDAVQAMQGALKTIAIHLYASPYHHSGQLLFDKPGDGYGFPLPFGGRDQAIGSDKTL